MLSVYQSVRLKLNKLQLLRIMKTLKRGRGGYKCSIWILTNIKRVDGGLFDYYGIVSKEKNKK